jgi:aspartokinase
MTNITERVNGFLNNDFIIRSCLFNNILSLRALSRFIIKKSKLEERNLDAVMSAIRRYKRDNKVKVQGRQKNIFSGITIKTKDNVVDIYLSKNKSVQEKLGNLNTSIDFEKGDILRIIQAEQGIRIIIDEKNAKSFNEIFSKKDVISVNKSLAEVNIQFPTDTTKTLGIISTISSSLTSENISIYEIMSSAPELILLVKNNDLIKTLATLNNLKMRY